jgi:cytidine deaminase
MLQQSEIDSIVERAVKVLPNAYNKYSNFPVGAALLTESGEIFVGGLFFTLSYNELIILNV